MTAAASDAMITFDRWTRKQLPLAASKTAFKGAIAMGRPSTGQVVPAVTGASTAGADDIFLGVFAEKIVNDSTTTTALVDVDFLKERTILWRANDGGISASDLFNDCYFVDDSTVSKTSTNRAKAGTILAVDTILGVGFEVEGT